jgi:hypothetical protein
MKNDIWVIASHMVQEYGADAPSAVHGRLVAMQSDRTGDQQFGLWYQIGLAVLDILSVSENATVP